MPWVKLDDGFYDHPKFADVGALGIALWAAGLAYCNRKLTDGHIPTGHMRRLVDLEGADPDVIAERLVNARLWDRCDDGYRVHDYLDVQRSAEQIKTTAEVRAEAGRKGAEAKHGKRPAKSQQTSGNLPANGQQPAGNGSGRTKNPNPTGANAPEHLPPAEPVDEQPGTALVLVKPSARPYEADFDAWYQRYPRKVGRGEAYGAYCARRRQGVPADDLLSAVTHYAAARAGEPPHFTKYPGTFLAKDGAWSEWVNGNPEPRTRASPTSKTGRSIAAIQQAAAQRAGSRDG